MKKAEVDQLQPMDRKHFTSCVECNEWFDQRSLDEVVFHCLGHQALADLEYDGGGRLGDVHGASSSEPRAGAVSVYTSDVRSRSSH